MTTHLDATFIEEMKALLEKERTELKRELGVLEKTAFPDYGRDDEDNALEMAEYVTNNATTQAEQEQLKAVEAALEKIASGTYGVTEDGQPIPEARLRANPAATTLATHS